MSEEKKAHAVLTQSKQNIKQTEAGFVHPAFAGVPNIAFDPHSPQKGSTSSLQTHEELEELINKVSSSLGFLMNKAHYEDLFVIAKSRNLSTELVWMYLRGAMRSDQVSMVNKLEKIVKSLEVTLSKNQSCLKAVADTNKQVTEKLALLSRKIDNVSPTIAAMITKEAKSIRALISGLETATAPLVPAQAASSSANASLHPGSPELLLIFQASKLPAASADEFVDRYLGKVTWDEYDTIITGMMTPEEVRELIKTWKMTK